MDTPGNDKVSVEGVEEPKNEGLLAQKSFGEQFEEARRTSPVGPLYVCMAIIGMLPISLLPPRTIKVHMWQSTLLYCMAMFTFYLWSAVGTVKQLWPVVMDKDTMMDDRVMVAEVLVHMGALPLMPFFWNEAPRVSNRTNNMVLYLGHHEELMGKRVNLRKLRREAVMQVLLIVLFAITTPFGAMTFMPELRLTYIMLPAFIAATLTQLLLGTTLITRNLVLCKAAKELLEELEIISEAEIVDVKRLRSIRSLWVELREMYAGCEQDGMLGVTMQHTLYMFFYFMLTVFEACVFIGTGNQTMALGQILLALIFFAEMCIMCNTSHKATRQMGAAYSFALDRLAARELGQDVTNELRFFYLTRSSKPAIISLCGYVDMDRGMFASTMSMILTYLVVMVQFREIAVTS